MGGLDEDFNIMELSREDHIIAHKILYKLYGKHQDLNAVRMLSGLPPIMTGKNNGMYGVVGEAHHMYGTKQSDETLRKKAEKRSANPRCQKGENHYNFGKKYDKPRNWKGGISLDQKAYQKAYREKNKNGDTG